MVPHASCSMQPSHVAFCDGRTSALACSAAWLGHACLQQPGMLAWMLGCPDQHDGTATLLPCQCDSHLMPGSRALQPAVQAWPGGCTHAGRLIDEMRAGAEPDMAPQELSSSQMMRLHQLMHEVKFQDPDGAHLSPAGEQPAPLPSARLPMCLRGQGLSLASCMSGSCCHGTGWMLKIIQPVPWLADGTQVGKSTIAELTRVSLSNSAAAGEYNLRLGITKELNPDLVATQKGVLCYNAWLGPCCQPAGLQEGFHRHFAGNMLICRCMQGVYHEIQCRGRPCAGGACLHCGSGCERGWQAAQAGHQCVSLCQSHPPPLRGLRKMHKASALSPTPPPVRLTQLGLRTLQGGSDVITKTALKRINWSSYKINQSTDRVGVFVSIVSTKIPYKGAGKEYIGMSRRSRNARRKTCGSSSCFMSALCTSAGKTNVACLQPA